MLAAQINSTGILKSWASSAIRTSLSMAQPGFFSPNLSSILRVCGMTRQDKYSRQRPGGNAGLPSLGLTDLADRELGFFKRGKPVARLALTILGLDSGAGSGSGDGSELGANSGTDSWAKNAAMSLDSISMKSILARETSNVYS